MPLGLACTVLDDRVLSMQDSVPPAELRPGRSAHLLHVAQKPQGYWAFAAQQAACQGSQPYGAAWQACLDCQWISGWRQHLEGLQRLLQGPDGSWMESEWGCCCHCKARCWCGWPSETLARPGLGPPTPALACLLGLAVAG